MKLVGIVHQGLDPKGTKTPIKVPFKVAKFL